MFKSINNIDKTLDEATLAKFKEIVEFAHEGRLEQLKKEFDVLNKNHTKMIEILQNAFIQDIAKTKIEDIEALLTKKPDGKRSNIEIFYCANSNSFHKILEASNLGNEVLILTLREVSKILGNEVDEAIVLLQSIFFNQLLKLYAKNESIELLMSETLAEIYKPCRDNFNDLINKAVENQTVDENLYNRLMTEIIKIEILSKNIKNVETLLKSVSQDVIDECAQFAKQLIFDDLKNAKYVYNDLVDVFIVCGVTPNKIFIQSSELEKYQKVLLESNKLIAAGMYGNARIKIESVLMQIQDKDEKKELSQELTEINSTLTAVTSDEESTINIRYRLKQKIYKEEPEKFREMLSTILTKLLKEIIPDYNHESKIFLQHLTNSIQYISNNQYPSAVVEINHLLALNSILLDKYIKTQLEFAEQKKLNPEFKKDDDFRYLGMLFTLRHLAPMFNKDNDNLIVKILGSIESKQRNSAEVFGEGQKGHFMNLVSNFMGLTAATMMTAKSSNASQVTSKEDNSKGKYVVRKSNSTTVGDDPNRLFSGKASNTITLSHKNTQNSNDDDTIKTRCRAKTL